MGLCRAVVLSQQRRDRHRLILEHLSLRAKSSSAPQVTQPMPCPVRAHSELSDPLATMPL